MKAADRSQRPDAARRKVLREILPAVRANCLISDAVHSGLYSLCGLFLRLKDLYLWEQGLAPWSAISKEQLLAWIEEKEALWGESLEAPFHSLRIDKKPFDILDSSKINQQLLPLGLFYGAGFGRGLKPAFFLGRVQKRFSIQGFQTVVLDREYACDLFLMPALRQGKTIVIRLEPLRFFLWGKIQETEQFERQATALALSYYGWDWDSPPGKQLEGLVRREMPAFLYHELGEAKDRTLPQGIWRRILSTYPHSRIEIYLRSLKDLLADTHPAGTLPFIIGEKRKGSLAFYLSNLKGMAKALFPDMIPAVKQFREDENWPAIEEVRKRARQRFVQQGRRIRELFADLGPANAARLSKVFEREFMQSLGL
jgi:hypothetical protein